MAMKLSKNDGRRTTFSNLFMARNQLLTEEISQSRGSIKRFSRSEQGVGGWAVGFFFKKCKKMSKMNNYQKMKMAMKWSKMDRNGPRLCQNDDLGLNIDCPSSKYVKICRNISNMTKIDPKISYNFI